MNYIPKGHIKVPKIRHEFVTTASLPRNVQQCIHVNKHLYKDEVMDELIYRGRKVDCAYVKQTETYQFNLNALHGYIMDLYYVVSHYLSDAQIAKILDAIYDGGTHIWHQWISIDMLMSESFSNKHVKTLKCLQYILSSHHLKFQRNHKCERWFIEERINLSEVKNVFSPEALEGVA